MSKIVVGIDGSRASRSALRWAAEEARLRGALLHVVHTWTRPSSARGPTPRMKPRYEADTDATERRIAERLVERELDSISSRLRGIRIERELREGSAAQTLIAASEDADLLVLGSSRHGVLADAILGAVGEECLRRGHCPLVTVRDDAAPGRRGNI